MSATSSTSTLVVSSPPHSTSALPPSHLFLQQPQGHRYFNDCALKLLHCVVQITRMLGSNDLSRTRKGLYNNIWKIMNQTSNKSVTTSITKMFPTQSVCQWCISFECILKRTPKQTPNQIGNRRWWGKSFISILSALSPTKNMPKSPNVLYSVPCQNADITVCLAASRLISAALPLPRKYM